MNDDPQSRARASDERPPEGRPEFGPGGYLPERASRRARKIVLRAPMGMQWIVGAIVAGVIIVAAGLVWLAVADDPPREPWVAIGPLAELDESTTIEELDVLIVAIGRPRAFTGLERLGLRWCAPVDQVEGAGGQVWSPTGRARTPDTDSLEQHPTRVHDGILYVDPTAVAPGPSPLVTDAEPAC